MEIPQGRAVLAFGGGAEATAKTITAGLIALAATSSLGLEAGIKRDKAPLEQLGSIWDMALNNAKDIPGQVINGWHGDPSTLVDSTTDILANPVWLGLWWARPEVKLLDAAKTGLAPLIESETGSALMEFAAHSPYTKPLRWLAEGTPLGAISKQSQAYEVMSKTWQKEAEVNPDLFMTRLTAWLRGEPLGGSENFIKLGGMNRNDALASMRSAGYNALDEAGKTAEDSANVQKLLDIVTNKGILNNSDKVGSKAWKQIKIAAAKRLDYNVAQVNFAKMLATGVKTYMAPLWLSLRVGYHMSNT